MKSFFTTAYQKRRKWSFDLHQSYQQPTLFFFFFAIPSKCQQRCKGNETYLWFTIRLGYPSDQLHPLRMYLAGLAKQTNIMLQAHFQSETSKISMDYDICRPWKVHLSTSAKHLLLISVMFTKKWLPELIFSCFPGIIMI